MANFFLGGGKNILEGMVVKIFWKVWRPKKIGGGVANFGGRVGLLKMFGNDW